MKRLPLVPLAALVLAALLTGCGRDQKPLARVGKSVITVADWMAAAEGAMTQYPPVAEEAKAMLLEDLVRRKLLLLEAEQRGFFRDTLTTNYRRVKEEELLIQAVGRSLLPGNVAVSDDEVRAFHTQRDSSAHVQLLYTFSRNAAEAAAREIRETGDFARVADRYNPPGMLPPGGDIGDQVPGSMVPPLDDSLRTARPGTVIGPMESPAQGWFVMRVVSRKARPQAPYETERPQLTEMLRQRKQRSSAIRNLQRLRRGYALHVEPGGAQVIFHHFNSPPPGGPASYTPEARAQVLARWEGPDGPHRYTFADALADLDAPDREKPNAFILPAIEQWILVECTRRIEIAEGRRRGLPLDPRFRRQVDETVNNYVLEALYNEEVLAKTTRPDSSDARAAYDRNRGRFERLEAARLQVIDFPDSAAANRFLAHAGHAADLREAAKMVPGAPEVRDLDLTFPNADPEWSQLQPSLTTMREGDAIGPFDVRGQLLRVVKLIAKRSSVAPFEALDAGTLGMLAQEGLDLARERRLMTLIEELRRKYPVTVDEAALKKLPWPVTGGRPAAAM